jgi:hypothetical protein
MELPASDEWYLLRMQIKDGTASNGIPDMDTRGIRIHKSPTPWPIIDQLPFLPGIVSNSPGTGPPEKSRIAIEFDRLLLFRDLCLVVLCLAFGHDSFFGCKFVEKQIHDKRFV